MKKYILMMVLALCAITAVPTFAQDTANVLVPRSMLTREQLLQTRVGNVTKWSGMGQEIGNAVNSSLQAITTQTSAFADTKLGKVTMFIVAYKVVGHDFLQVIVATLFSLVWIPIWFYSYINNASMRRVVVQTTIDPLKTKTKSWKIINEDHDAERLAHFGIAGILILVTLFVFLV